MTAPRLIVGLGNPGPKYQDTRHNVGQWFVEKLSGLFSCSLQSESRFKAKIGKFTYENQDYFLLVPETFMNLSGQSLQTFTSFYKIQPDAVLVAHDELDLHPGIIRLKKDGGHGGHNGLRDIIQKLSTPKFYRLRIGIGHPGHASEVSAYVLSKPTSADKIEIWNAIDKMTKNLDLVLKGDYEKAMNIMHQK